MHGLGLLKSAVSRAFTSGRQALASLLLLSLVLTTPALASGQAETIVRLSPLGPIVEQSQAMMRTGIRDGLMATGQVDSLVAETIAGFGASAFDAARIRARLVNALTADLASNELQTVNEWYQSDLGQALSQAEARAASPAGWTIISESAPALRQQYKGSAREQLFKRYDQALGASEQATDTAIAVQLELAQAMAAFSENGSASAIRDRVQASRPIIQAEIADQVYLAYLHMYQSFPDEQLKTYVEFLESSAGRAFTESAGTSIRGAIVEPISRVGDQLVRLLGSGGK